MNRKSMIMLGMIVGSTIGGYLPILWGGSLFSVSSIMLTGVGGIFGVWLAYQLTKNL